MFQCLISTESGFGRFLFPIAIIESEDGFIYSVELQPERATTSERAYSQQSVQTSHELSI